MDEMSTIVTNATVNASLGFLFGSLVVIVLLDATRVCIQSIRTQRAGGVVQTTEVPHVPSQIVAPAGFLPTAEEKREMAAAGPRSPRHSGHSDDSGSSRRVDRSDGST
jgi:carbon starvation protein